MTITIPAELLPADGRFGCGPSKVRPEALQALAADGAAVMGTSHRQAPVKNLVKRGPRGAARSCSTCPTATRWCSATAGRRRSGTPPLFGLIRDRSAFGTYGEFSAKFASGVAEAPFLGDPVIAKAEPGSLALPTGAGRRRRLRLGAQRDLHRRHGAGRAARRRRRRRPGAHRRHQRRRRPAGRRRRRPTSTTSPRRSPSPPTAGCGSRSCRPTPSARVAEIKASGRWIPGFLDLSIAVDNSTKDQTYNTPAVATLFLLADQIRWLLSLGGLSGAVARTRDSSSRLYGWAEKSAYATPFVADPDAALPRRRHHRLRRLGGRRRAREDAARQRRRRRRALPQARPQPAARRACSRPSTPTTCSALTACIDHVVERL